VTEWGTVFLGVIAAATLLMALLQLGVAITALRLVKRVDRLTAEMQQEIRPLIARAQAVAEDASRIAALSAAQVERVDAIMATMGRRVDETATVLQQAIVAPAREGIALLAAFRAGIAALRGSRSPQPGAGRLEEEDALFIG
jgi:hypothetical protein